MDQRALMLVDDDEHVLAGLARAMVRHVDVVATATTTSEARAQFQRIRPCACVVDYHLPDGSGLELIRELRAADPGVMLVLISGYGSMEVGAAAIRAGADHVVAKPVSAATIAHLIQGGEPTIAPTTPSADRAMWEHVHRVLADCKGNKSAAARVLKIDRGTLQRWIDRPAPA
ncbi:MAG: response regulator [Kofleriaceae bacterium]